MYFYYYHHTSNYAYCMDFPLWSNSYLSQNLYMYNIMGPKNIRIIIILDQIHIRKRFPCADNC